MVAPRRSRSTAIREKRRCWTSAAALVSSGSPWPPRLRRCRCERRLAPPLLHRQPLPVYEPAAVPSSLLLIPPQVCGVDIDPAAALSANANARRNGVSNYSARCDNIEEALADLAADRGEGRGLAAPHVSCVAPPRTGWHRTAVWALRHCLGPRVPSASLSWRAALAMPQTDRQTDDAKTATLFEWRGPTDWRGSLATATMPASPSCASCRRPRSAADRVRSEQSGLLAAGPRRARRAAR